MLEREGGRSIHSGRELAAFSAANFASSRAWFFRASRSKNRRAPSLRKVLEEEEAQGRVGPTDGPTLSSDDADAELERDREKPVGSCGPAIVVRAGERDRVEEDPMEECDEAEGERDRR